MNDRATDGATDTTAKTAPARAIPWFAINVAVLCVLAPWATYWFQRHLQLYFTEIVVVGGAFTLWVFLRAMWAMLEKTAKVEPWAYSRKLLALPDITGLLAVAVVVFAVLWFRTASIYVEYKGAPGEGEYRVEVVRKADGSPLIPGVSLTAANRVIGRPFLWQREKSELECRILQPVKYETLPCALEPGRSTRILVPGSFKPREFHLLRIVPSGQLYSQMPTIDDKPDTRYELELRRADQAVVLGDLRRETVYIGAAANEMPILMELEPPGALEHYLRRRLQTRSFESPSIEMTTAMLSSATRSWPTFYLRSGDELTFTVRVTRPQEPTIVFEGFPVHYTVTADKVQTVWLPE